MHDKSRSTYFIFCIGSTIFLLQFFFSRSSFITIDSKYLKWYIIFFHKNFATVFAFKLNKARVFIQSIKSFFIITNTFINFDRDKWTRSIFIFWNRFEIQMKWSVFFSIENTQLTWFTVNNVFFTVSITILSLISVRSTLINSFALAMFVFVIKLLYHNCLIFYFINEFL